MQNLEKLSRFMKMKHANNLLFCEWLAQNTKLSQKSIINYQGGINATSNDMLKRNIIDKSIFEMDLNELDNALSKIIFDTHFIAKDTKGNKMYSVALKQYRYFLATYFCSMVLDSTTNRKNKITQKETKTKIRIGQNNFRKELLQKYQKCVITGLNNPLLLIASHIKPWAVSNDTERLDINNGILLSATYDKLFDNGLISFKKNGALLVSSFLNANDLKILELNKNQIFNLQMNTQMQIFLQYHNDVLFVK